MLARSVPIGAAVFAFTAMGIGVFLTLHRTILGLEVHKFEADHFWITGFSKQFLNYVSASQS